MKATLYRCFDDVLVALFRACADIKAEHSLNMIEIKKEMFHNSHLFYESLAEGYKSNVAQGELPTVQQAQTSRRLFPTTQNAKERHTRTMYQG